MRGSQIQERGVDREVRVRGRGKREEKRRQERKRKKRKPRPQLESLPGALELRRVGADLISQVKADADATELQGDGEALGECIREKRIERQPRPDEFTSERPVAFFFARAFFSLLLRKRNGMDTSEASTRASVEEGRRQPGLREARQPDSRTTNAKKLLLISRNDLTGFQAHKKGSRYEDYGVP